MSYQHLIDKAYKLRQSTLIAFIEKGEAHLGGSFSMIELLVAVHEKVLTESDRFILSKSHASFPFLLVLREKGYFPEIRTHLEIDASNGIHCTTGSLGHGLPIGVGMAVARKYQKRSGRVFVMMSDGECQEGTTWESLLIAAKQKLNNLIILIDYNNMQALTSLDDGLPLADLASKFRAFNWDCIEIADGHSFDQLISGLGRLKVRTKPIAVIARTVKGKGVKEFECDPAWHARKLRGEELKIAKATLKVP